MEHLDEEQEETQGSSYLGNSEHAVFDTYNNDVRAYRASPAQAIIVVLIIAAIAASEWREWQDSKELPPTEIVEESPVEEDKPDILQKIWDDSKAHFIVFGGLAITLFIVKCRNETKLTESGGKIKK